MRNFQEEADTKVFLCSLHAGELGMKSVLITTVDSDIVLYACYFYLQSKPKIYVRIGCNNRVRVVSIDKISKELGNDCCLALPALHAFTGNDYTSAFYGIGKGKALNILRKSKEYLHTFARFGDSFRFDADLFELIEKFVCCLYGSKQRNTDDARYEKFLTGKKCPDPQKLPPTRDALLCHCKRVSYVTAIIKKSLMQFPNIPSPNGFGWTESNETLSIQWMLRDPAPAEVLQLLSCNCKKSKCSNRMCICFSHGLNCSDLCDCSEECVNVKDNEIDSSSDSSSDSSDTLSD